MLLPGAVLPTEPTYEALQLLGERVEAVAKDLEVYSGDQLPSDFGLDTEVSCRLLSAQEVCIP
jgi:hypothetical protein